MTSIPFSVYDVFAYLASGSVLLATLDYVLGSRLLLRDELTVPQIVVLLFLAYIAGHLVESLSIALLQHGIVHRVVGRPSELLMGRQPRAWLRPLFPGYFYSLPPETQARVVAQARSRGLNELGGALVLHARSVVSQFEPAQKRLDVVRNLFGFARNMSLALLVVAAVLAIGTARAASPPSYVWSAIAFLAAIVMFYRYLTFYREYNYLLLVTYAELPRPKPEAQA